jgi:hypothetical protein
MTYAASRPCVCGQPKSSHNFRDITRSDSRLGCVASGCDEYRPVSTEAAHERIPLTDADRAAKRGKMHGTELTGEEAERVRRMLDGNEPSEAAPPRAVSLHFWHCKACGFANLITEDGSPQGPCGQCGKPDAAPPRATTPPDAHDAKLRLDAEAVLTWEYQKGSDPLAFGHLRRFAKEIVRLLDERASLAPSREGGALLLDAYVAEMTRLTRDLSQVDTVRAARAAVDRYIASLERDAATMREEITRLHNKLNPPRPMYYDGGRWSEDEPGR